MPRRRKEEHGDAYFISKTKAAKMLGVSKTHVQGLISSKILVTYPFGKHVRVGTLSVLEFAKNPEKFKPEENAEELLRPSLKIEDQNKNLLRGVFK